MQDRDSVKLIRLVHLDVVEAINLFHGADA